MTREEAAKRIAGAAVECEKAYGFPAEVLAAQCALETGWLSRAPGNNAFGMKYIPGKNTDKQLLITREWFTEDELAHWLAGAPGREVLAQEAGPDSRGRNLYRVRDWFVRYASLLDSCADYVRLLTRGRYKAAWEAFQRTRKVDDLVRGIAKAGYSTTHGYADHVLTVLHGDELQAAIRQARGSNA